MVEGSVVDPSGAPIAGAEIVVQNAQATVVHQGLTGSGGVFSIPGLALGSYVLQARAKDFADRTVVLPVTAGPVKLLRIVLDMAPVRSEVTVSATRGSVEDVGTADRVVTVRSRVDFSQRVLPTIGHALETGTGIVVQETTHGQVSPYLRGLTGYQTLLLLDGIRYNTSIFRSGPNQYLAFVQPGQVERIEAALGPSGATYGSDSMGGTINVLTLEPRFASARRPEIHGELGNTVSSADMGGTAGGLITIGGPRLSLLLGISGQRRNDLRGGAGKDSRNAFTRYLGLTPTQVGGLLGSRMQGTAFGAYGTEAKLAWRPSGSQSLTAWYEHSALDGVRSYRDQLGGPGRMIADVTPQGLNFGYLRYEKLGLGRLDSLSGTLSINSQRDGFVRQDLRPTGPITTDRSRVDSLGCLAQGTFHLGSRQALIFGGEVYDERVFSTRFLQNPVAATQVQQRAQYPNDSRYRTSALFIQDTMELVPGKLRATLGARFTDIHFKAWASRNVTAAGESLGVADASRAFRDLTFNGSLAWSATRALQFHVLVGRGFRAPNMNDLGGTGLTTLGYDIAVEDVASLNPLVGIDSSETAVSSGNHVRRLLPESLMNYETGFRIDTKKVYWRVHVFDAEFLNPISARTLLFPANAVPTQIAGVPVTPVAPSAAQREQGVVAVATALSPRAVKTSVNDGHTRYYGAESLFRYRLSSRLTAEAGYTFMAGRDLNPNRPSRRIPPQNGFASTKYIPSGRRAWLEIAARFAGAQTRMNAGDLDDDRIGASRRRQDIADFFRGGVVAPYLSAGGLFIPTGETLLQIQNRVLPLGTTINGVRVLGDSTRVPLYAKTNGWAAIDIRGGAPLSERLVLEFGVMNLLDRNYRIHGSGIDCPGVNVFLGVRYVY